MTQRVDAIYEDGVLKPLQPLDLQDRDVVSILVDTVPNSASERGAHGTLYDALQEAGLIGCIKDAPPDLSTNPKYLEGFGASGE